MTYKTFNSLTEQLIAFFQNKQYAEALDLITRETSNFPNDRLWADYWKMCAAARVGNRSLVFEVAEKSLSDGLWYGEMMWRQTPSFQPLQGDAEFERIVGLSRLAEEKDTPTGKPIMITRLPEHLSPSSPLLIALHGNQGTAARTLPFWEASLTQGWVLALPQSTQAMFKGAYGWDDIEKSSLTVKDRFGELTGSVAFNQNHVALAGHSMGGFIALDMALRGVLNIRGFIVNGPAVPFTDAPDELETLLAPARERGLRGYFIVGDKDTDINVDEIRALTGILIAARIPCELEMVPGATHDYTPGYDEALLRGLAFVNAG